MTEKFYVDSNGAWIGAFEGSEPAGGIEVPFAPDNASQIWNVGTQTYSSALPTVYRLAKTTPWLRMTSSEAQIMDAVMSETDAQQKQIYMAAQYLQSDDPLWQTMWTLLKDNLPGGADRADELLAPET